VMSALGPMSEEAPPLQPENTNSKETDGGRGVRNKPILSAGTGL
jgi:two-component system, cell cycle sensor histidine kinase PleC